MINLDVRFSQNDGVEIAGDEDALQELRAGLKWCAENGFDFELPVASSLDPSPYEKLLSRIVISMNDMDNVFSIVGDALVIQGDDNFLLNVRSNIPWDAVDSHSGLSCHVHYDRSSFSDYLDEDSLDVLLTKKRRA